MPTAYLTGLISYSVKPAFPALEKQNGVLKNALQTIPQRTARPYALVDTDGQQTRGRAGLLLAPAGGPAGLLLQPTRPSAAPSLPSGSATRFSVSAPQTHGDQDTPRAHSVGSASLVTAVMATPHPAPSKGKTYPTRPNLETHFKTQELSSTLSIYITYSNLY